MALGVHAADQNQPVRMSGFLAATAVLGGAFLAIKGYEYHHEISKGLLPGASFHLEESSAPAAQMFFYLYFVMTGIHALHLTIGIGLVGVFLARTVFSRSPRRLALAVNQLGLYWHFVDLVWVFLFPLFYLAGRSS
jgi:cytochrome c oxidase subunit 3